MYSFHFVNIFDILDIQEPLHDGIPPDSPIFIFYKEKGDLSKHEILRKFLKILTDNNIRYLRPLNSLTSEWVVDLQEFKYNHDCLKKANYLKGKIRIEPDYEQDKKIDEYTGEIISTETRIKFSIYPDDVKMYANKDSALLPEELKTSLEKFRKDYPSGVKCAFLMMKFEDTPIQLELIKIIKKNFKKNKIQLLRADHKLYSDDLFNNIRTYMHGCDFGVAIFERVNSEYFNPNVSLEIGYMMAMSKDVLLLKDNTLNSLHTDLVGKLYYEYDFQNPSKTIPKVLNKWIKDKEI